MKYGLVILSFFYFFGGHAFASTNSKSLQKSLELYSKASSVQAEIKKTDEKVILGSRDESQGFLKYQKGQLFIQLNGDKKNEFYFNGQTLTLVEYPDTDFAPNGARKVTHLKKSIPPFVKNLLSLFSRPKDFNKQFKVISEKKEGSALVLELASDQKNFKNFSIKINTDNQQIQEIVFVDDVDTKTTIVLHNVKLNQKIKKSDMTIKKLKSDEVIKE